MSGFAGIPNIKDRTLSNDDKVRTTTKVDWDYLLLIQLPHVSISY